MRVWHPTLIPKLCRNHLLAMWRENLGLYSIIINNKQGYRNHPQTIQYQNHPHALYKILIELRKEMLKRHYNPKPLPPPPTTPANTNPLPEWESLQTQITKLRAKQCACQV